MYKNTVPDGWLKLFTDPYEEVVVKEWNRQVVTRLVPEDIESLRLAARWLKRTENELLLGCLDHLDLKQAAEVERIRKGLEGLVKVAEGKVKDE